VQDGWLKKTLQPIFASPAWTTQRSLLILTWDESDAEATNHIATIMIGSQGLVGSGAISTAPYNHYNAGRTIEAALGIGQLTANDTYASPTNDAFVPYAKAPAFALAANMPQVQQGENIAFTFSTTQANLNASNWIGIYPAGKTPGSVNATAWAYATTVGGVTSFSTASLAPGNYVAYYCYNNGYTVLAGPAAFNVSQ
jgi:hypothetical protein